MLTEVAVGLAVLVLVAGVFGKVGVEVDRQRYAWRSYYQILGLTFGRWQKLPPVTGVVLKYFSSTTNSTPGTISSTANWNNTSTKNEELVLMLSVAGSRTGIILGTTALSKLVSVRAFAQEIAQELQVPVNEFLPPANPGCGE